MSTFSALFHASLSSPPHLPSSRRPPYRQRHVYQRRCTLPEQAAVFHTPQPGGPGDRKGTLDITPRITLGIPRLETGRTSGRGLRRRHQGQHKGAPPGQTKRHRPGRLTGSRGGSGITTTMLGGVSAPALASPRGAPPAGLPALDRAPPQGSRDRSTHANTHSALASDIARAKHGYEVAQATVLRREALR